MDAHFNLLLCGYLREMEKLIKLIIPTVILEGIDLYCLTYNLYGIGNSPCGELGISKTFKRYTNLPDIEELISTPNNIYLHGTSTSIIDYKNELYRSGLNDCHQLAIENLNMFNTYKFNKVTGYDGKVDFVSSGNARRRTFIYTSNGTLYASGIVCTLF